MVNPAIEWLDTDIAGDLANALAQPGVGLAYPVAAKDKALDFEGALPTPRTIVLRKLGLLGGVEENHPGVSWVSGAFMAFNTDVFAAFGGFDKRYFVYCDDEDIGLRVQLAGNSLAWVDAIVLHHTQRNTLKNLRHLTWHVYM